MAVLVCLMAPVALARRAPEYTNNDVIMLIMIIVTIISIISNFGK